MLSLPVFALLCAVFLVGAIVGYSARRPAIDRLEWHHDFFSRRRLEVTDVNDTETRFDSKEIEGIMCEESDGFFTLSLRYKFYPRTSSGFRLRIPTGGNIEASFGPAGSPYDEHLTEIERVRARAIIDALKLLRAKHFLESREMCTVC